MKRIPAIASVLLLVCSLLAGCSGTGGLSSEGPYSAEPSASRTDKVVFATWTINALPSETAIREVEDAVNRITEAKIGVTVDLRIFPFSEYSSKVALALQGGEQIDVFTSLGAFSSNVSQKMCFDITDMVDAYLPDARKYISDEWLSATTVNGRVYGIAAWMPVTLAANLLYRSDIAEELGLDMDAVTCAEDLTDVLRQVKKAHPEMDPMAGTTGVNGGVSGLTVSIPGIDYLGDDMYSPAGVLIGDSTTVVNLFETEEYRKRVALARQWHEENLIMRDLATTTLSNIEILSAGNAFANITLQGSAPDLVAGGFTLQTGQHLRSRYLGSAYLSSGSVNTNAWCVSSTCEKPEAALKFLNLIYGDSEVINLIVYGIEGRDYVVNADGTVQAPEGLDSASVPYPGYYILTGSWSMGDMFRQAGTTEEQVRWNIDHNRNADISPAMGFCFDSSRVRKEYTTVNSVIRQYYAALDCGAVDPETELPRFIAALKDAGIDAIIAEKQAQLDAWLASR